nr:hypothetical protein [Tanacetum cinerariifolium]
EAIHLILTGIGDDIYSTVDACKSARDMWVAIRRLQQCKSLNKQDVSTNLFWEFGKFTSRDGESIESYYSRFYKMMNEVVRNQLEVATMNQRTMIIVGARETVGSQAKDYNYHKETMLLCKHAEKGVSLCVEQIDFLDDTDEKVDSNSIPDSSDMSDNEGKAEQNAKERDDERVVPAKLITNLKLATDENKKIQKQLKKANASIAQELKECKSILDDSNRTRDRYLVALHDKEIELEKYKR